MENENNSTLVIYTLNNCIYCNYLKGGLNDLGINYREYIIDNGNEYDNLLGNSLERRYKTENYPIIEIVNQFKKKISFISKTDLEEQEGIIIFDDIEQLIKQIKIRL